MNPSQALQAKILGIFAAVIAGVGSWKAPTNLGNIVGDIKGALGVVDAIDPNALNNALGKEIEGIPAEFTAVSNGSVAILGDIPASFDGQPDDIMLFGVRKYKNGPAPAGSDAELLKQRFGT